MVLGFWAQHRVKSTFAKNLEVPVANGMTGAQVARRILDANGLNEVPVEETPGLALRSLRPAKPVGAPLEPVSSTGVSVASTAVGAHEVGPRDPARAGVRVLPVPQRDVPRRAVRLEHLDAVPARRDLPQHPRLHLRRDRALRASPFSSSSSRCRSSSTRRAVRSGSSRTSGSSPRTRPPGCRRPRRPPRGRTSPPLSPRSPCSCTTSRCSSNR